MFLIEDTILNNSDTVFILSFQPKLNKTFNALKGLLYINTDGYALQNVIARPASKKGLKIKIQQQYEKIDDKEWFPKQLNTEISINNFNFNGISPIFSGRTYISDVNLNPEFEKGIFSASLIEIEEKSDKKDNDFWNKYRKDSITDKDLKTYEVIDSIGKEANIDRMIETYQILKNGYISYRKINLNLTDFIRWNNHTGLRPGLSFFTNNKLSNRLVIGGHTSYGIRDKKINYGLNTKINIQKDAELAITASYDDDVKEIGSEDAFYENKLFNDTYFREFLFTSMDDVKKISAGLQFRTLRYLNLGFNISKIDKIWYQAKERNEYYSNSIRANNTFTEFSVKARYAYKERFIKTEFQKSIIETKYPICWLTLTKGLNNLFGGDFNYYRIDLKMSKTFTTRYIGKTSFILNAGFIDNSLPTCQLFNAKGSWRSFTVDAPNSFATMRMDEFFSNQYGSLFIAQDFGSLIFGKKGFSPHIKFITNIGIGKLKKTNEYIPNTLLDIKSMDRGYYESGLVFNKLMDWKILNFGLGFYYRYGSYSYDKTIDNLSIKLTIKSILKN